MKLIATAAAIAACACLTVPASAQDEPEQPRTTWRMQLINLKPETGTRFEDIVLERIIPAYEAAGLPVPQYHWVALSDWDAVIVSQLPDGMHTFDMHNPPARTALFRELVRREGSEEAVQAMFAELRSYVEDEEDIYSHTH